ncbi:hypothetical protein FF2_021801 [Malus domestica]
MLHKGMEPDPPAYTFVMEPASWTIRRRWRTDAAISMKHIMDMVEGVLPAIVTHTAVIEAYATAGKIKGAFEAYKHMSAVGIMPNCYTYSVFIKALATDPNFFGDAKKYWLEMMEKRMHPNAATYTAVFGGFARQGDRAVEDRSEFLRVMKSKGFVPDEEAVGEVLKGRTGEAVSCIMNILFGKYNL